MKDIAREAGVHISTVDKVLHNRVGVSDEVRGKVQKIIDEKGYKTNPAGRKLQKAGKQFRIAALLLEVDAEPFIRKGIDQFISDNQDLDIRIDYHRTCFNDAKTQADLILEAVRQKTDGILVFPHHSEEIRKRVEQAAGENIPIVTVNSDVDHSSRLAYVGHDSVRGARMAGRMLGILLSGKGTVAIITSEDYLVSTRRRQFELFMEMEYPGIRIADCVDAMEDQKIAYQRTMDLLGRYPDLDGIYIAGGRAEYVGKAVEDAGFTGRVHVVSFEEYPEILNLIRRGIFDCTIGGDLAEQGRRGMQVLMDYLVYDRKPDSEYIYIESRILVKECFE